ncbi:AAA family ATPase [Agrobacterium sp. P15N1-A]|uniref:AAA family ATPase n=1 Tax=Agrobacterium sp. P15N1-A TaxID=3342820 RepID=UPI0037D0C484
MQQSYDSYFREAAESLLGSMDPKLRDRAAHIGEMNTAYIGTARDIELDEAFEALIVNSVAELFGKSGKRRALFVVGESGSGKTTAVAKHISKRSELAPKVAADGTPYNLLIDMEAPMPLTVKGLATNGLKRLGYYVNNPRLTAGELFELWKDQLRQQRVLFLAIDELQHVLKSDNVKELQTVADVIKSLLQIPGWPLHLILSGVPELAGFLHQSGQTNRQLKERSKVIEFRRMTFPEDIPVMTKVVNKIVTVEASLKADPVILSEEFVHRLLHASCGAFGSMIQTTRHVCEVALRRGAETVGPELFASAYALESGCRPSQNIFTAKENWKDILPANSMRELVDEGRMAQQKRAKTGK